MRFRLIIVIAILAIIVGCVHSEPPKSSGMDKMHSIYNYCTTIEGARSEWGPDSILITYTVLVDEGRKFWSAYSVFSEAHGQSKAKSELKNIVRKMGASYILCSPYGKKLISDEELFSMIIKNKKTGFWTLYVDKHNEYESFIKARNAKIHQ